jgi:hypothetical protein
LDRLRSESTILDFETRGEPATHYTLRFFGKGVWRPDNSQQTMMRDAHEVRVVLGASYPRMMPELTWVSPIFHPNISASGVVCLGGYGTHWVPSLSLDVLCEMLWDMIRYRNYDVDSPYNREAAMWARSQSTYLLPLDPRPIRDRLAAEASLPSGRVPGSSLTYSSSPHSEVRIESAPLGHAPEEIVEAEIVEVLDEDIVFLD